MLFLVMYSELTTILLIRPHGSTCGMLALANGDSYILLWRF